MKRPSTSTPDPTNWHEGWPAWKGVALMVGLIGACAAIGAGLMLLHEWLTGR